MYDAIILLKFNKFIDKMEIDDKNEEPGSPVRSRLPRESSMN